MAEESRGAQLTRLVGLGGRPGDDEPEWTLTAEDFQPIQSGLEVPIEDGPVKLPGGCERDSSELDSSELDSSELWRLIEHLVMLLLKEKMYHQEVREFLSQVYTATALDDVRQGRQVFLPLVTELLEDARRLVLEMTVAAKEAKRDGDVR